MLAQLALALCLALAFAVLASPNAGWSAFVGGGIAALANLYFAQRLLGSATASPRKILRRLFVGELLKLLITAVLFAAVILWLPLAFAPFFVSYALTLMVNWLALLKI